MTTGLDRVIAAYHEVTRITQAHIYYVYGGGHNAAFSADPGLDCSGFVCRVFHVAGILGIPHVPFPEDTHRLEGWGNPGPGRWLTLWDRDDRVQDHCFLEFSLWRYPVFRDKYKMRFAQAPHEGLQVGWLDSSTGLPWVNGTEGFNPRHWPNT